MTFLEKNLEDIIFTSDNDLLSERGLGISGKKIRQLKIGNYGIADLITYQRPSYHKRNIDGGGGWHEELFINIFELKQNVVNVNTVLQAVRYGTGIKHYFRNKPNLQIDFCITVVGKYIDLNSDFIYLSNFMPNLNVFTYDYKIDGIYFEEHREYKLIKSGF